MKLNELRIGNWVMYNDENTEPMPRPVQIDVPDLILMHEGVKECVYAPILLTPEILVKCGFEKVRVNIWAIELWDIATHLELIEGAKNCYYPAISQQQPEGLEQNVLLRYIEHLHSLQNLYFALTGSELEVNL
jgi:hypothetical protein